MAIIRACNLTRTTFDGLRDVLLAGPAQLDIYIIFHQNRPRDWASRMAQFGFRGSLKVVSRPNAAQAAGRLLALRCVVTYALATPARDQLEHWFGQWSDADREQFVQKSDSRARAFWQTVSKSPIFEYLSPWERRFSNSTIITMSSQQHIDALWRIEAAQVLAWALLLLPELPAPINQTDGDFLKAEKLSQPAEFLASAELRGKRRPSTRETWLNSGTGAAAPSNSSAKSIPFLPVRNSQNTASILTPTSCVWRPTAHMNGATSKR